MIQLYEVNGAALIDVPSKRLAKEDDLQRWIAENPSIIGLQLLVLGREIPTGFGRIDVLALDSEGNLVVIECKRDRTPRDVIAQLLDYGSWIAGLTTREIHELANTFLPKPLGKAYTEIFDSTLPETLNRSHSLIVVAAEFDASSRRIVEYLAQVHKLSINAVFFSSFQFKGTDLLAIEWLLDQAEVVERADSKSAAPWTGLNYVNIGESKDRHWEDFRRFGFISAGGGKKYIGALQRLAPGDLVITYQKKIGYVGLGKVTESAVAVSEFRFEGVAASELSMSAPDFLHDLGNISMCEFVVRVEWLKTYSLGEAKTFPGAFANQNIVCKLRDPATLSFLTNYFPLPSDDLPA